MAIDIVDFPIDSMVIFHSFLYIYQRVFNMIKGWYRFSMVLLPSSSSNDESERERNAKKFDYLWGRCEDDHTFEYL